MTAMSKILFHNISIVSATRFPQMEACAISPISRLVMNFFLPFYPFQSPCFYLPRTDKITAGTLFLNFALVCAILFPLQHITSLESSGGSSCYLLIDRDLQQQMTFHHLPLISLLLVFFISYYLVSRDFTYKKIS